MLLEVRVGADTAHSDRGSSANITELSLSSLPSSVLLLESAASLLF